MISIETAAATTASTGTDASSGTTPEEGFLAVLSSLLTASSGAVSDAQGVLLPGPLPLAHGRAGSGPGDGQPGSGQPGGAWPGAVQLAALLHAQPRTVVAEPSAPNAGEAVAATTGETATTAPVAGDGGTAPGTEVVSPLSRGSGDVPGRLDGDPGAVLVATTSSRTGTAEVTAATGGSVRVTTASESPRNGRSGKVPLPSDAAGADATDPGPDTEPARVSDRGELASVRFVSDDASVSNAAADGASGSPVLEPVDTVAAPRPSETAAGSRMLTRILDAVEQLENAPPPRQLTLEVGELRLRLSLEDGNVRMQLLGDQREAGQHLLRDAETALRARGFDLQGDDRGGRRGDGRGSQHEQPTPASSPPTSTRGRGSDTPGLRL